MNLELYHRWECPYSARVRTFIENNGLSSVIRYIDIEEEEEAVDRLMDLTGRRQVPCLVVDGSNPILESHAIVHWIERNVLHGRVATSP